MDQASKASLLLMFFAVPISLALVNVLMVCTLVFWLCKISTESDSSALKQVLENPISRPALALAVWIVGTEPRFEAAAGSASPARPSTAPTSAQLAGGKK